MEYNVQLITTQKDEELDNRNFYFWKNYILFYSSFDLMWMLYLFWQWKKEYLWKVDSFPITKNEMYLLFNIPIDHHVLNNGKSVISFLIGMYVPLNVVNTYRISNINLKNRLRKHAYKNFDFCFSRKYNLLSYNCLVIPLALIFTFTSTNSITTI